MPIIVSSLGPDHRAVKTMLLLNPALKVGLIILLVLGLIASDWLQFQGKAMEVRALLYPVSALVLPALWWSRGRPSTYPHLLDMLVVLPFFLDTAGNVLNLFNTTEYFDRVLHWLNWLILATAFGGYVSAFKLARINVLALGVGFGATTAVLWEIIEYILMRLGAGGLQLTYQDTIEDLALSFAGAVCGSVLLTTLIWDRGLVPEEWMKRRR